MSVGEVVLGALSGGGALVARVEIARLVQGAVQRLSRRGQVGRELAIVADALGRSDDDVAKEMQRLSEEQRGAAAGQLDQALTYDGPDVTERDATRALGELGEQVRTALSGVQTSGQVGHVIHATDHATVHAPGAVGRDYIAGNASGTPTTES